eukprot:jgi/Bigna1/66835/fgenesh1_pg.2_\
MDIRNFFSLSGGSKKKKKKTKTVKKSSGDDVTENESPKNATPKSARKASSQKKKKRKSEGSSTQTSRKKRKSKIVVSDSDSEDDIDDDIDDPIDDTVDDDEDFVTPVSKKKVVKSPGKKRTAKKKASKKTPQKSPKKTPKKAKKTKKPKEEIKEISPEDFFNSGSSSSKKKVKKSEDTSSNDEDINLAKALSLSESESREEASKPSTSHYFEQTEGNTGKKEKKKKAKRRDTTKKFNWQWKSDLNAKSTKGWTDYSEDDNKFLQENWESGEEVVELPNGYSVNLEQMIQFKTKDPHRQRPIQKVVKPPSSRKGAKTTKSDDNGDNKEKRDLKLEKQASVKKEDEKKQKVKVEKADMPKKATPPPPLTKQASEPLLTTGTASSNSAAGTKRKWSDSLRISLPESVAIEYGLLCLNRVLTITLPCRYPGMQRGAPPKAGQKEIPEGKPNCLQGLTFVITGTLDSLERDEAGDLIKQYGGRVTGGVSGKTSYLIAGAEAGATKMKKAEQKGVKVVDEDFLLNLIRSRESQAAPTPKPNKKRKTSSSVKSGKQEATSASTASTGESGAMLWVDKHKPKGPRDLIGNNSNIKKLTTFLNDWRTAMQRKNTSGIKKKAVLLAGNAGLGKSSAAEVVCRSLGFNKIESNASDVRNKAHLEQKIVAIARNRGIMEFMGGAKKKGAGGPTCLVMDEVDGMSGNSDRGGMQLLIKIIKSTQVPIICICNDSNSQKMRSLKNYCEVLKFRRPTAAQIAPRIMRVLEAEGMRVERNALEQVVDATRGDIRQILNLMQMWKKKKDNLNYSDAKFKMGKNSGKDFDLGPFDVIGKVFTPDFKKGFVIRKSEPYFVDFSLMPLMVEENYLGVRRFANSPLADKSKRADVQELEALAMAATSFSDADLCDTQLRRNQDYSLMPYHAAFTCVIPGSYLAGGLGRPAFPSWLGKFSSRNKNKRFFDLLKANMSVDSTSSATDLALYQIPHLRRQMLKPMIDEGLDGVDTVIKTLDEYSLDRNDWEMISELGTRFGNPLSLKQIPGKIKAAFTRTYNQKSHMLKVARQDLKAVRRKAKAEAKREAVGGDGEDDVDDEDEMPSSSSSSKGKTKGKAKKRTAPKKKGGAKKKGGKKKK